MEDFKITKKELDEILKKAYNDFREKYLPGIKREPDGLINYLKFVYFYLDRLEKTRIKN
ncbi:MAG: hypothetical protein LBF97_02845 [Elusimicrobiota bacterium]|jgi:hypothetical protein|nr:hypothetical protein [Elusimicrobiota bacterium]